MIGLFRQHSSIAATVLLVWMSWSGLSAGDTKEAKAGKAKRPVLEEWYISMADDSVPRPVLRDPCDLLLPDVPEGDADEDSSEADSSSSGDEILAYDEEPAVMYEVGGLEESGPPPASSFTLTLEATLALGSVKRARVSGMNVGVGDALEHLGLDEAPIVSELTATTVTITWNGQTHELDINGTRSVTVPVELTPTIRGSEAGSSWLSNLPFGLGGDK